MPDLRALVMRPGLLVEIFGMVTRRSSAANGASGSGTARMDNLTSR